MRSRSSVAGRTRVSIPSAAASRSGDARQRHAGAQGLRADDVQTEVQVAELEPRVAAELADGFERTPGLARATPTAFLVVQPREGVEDRVEIGRDVEPEHLDVVADVSDHGDVTRRDLDEPLDEAGAAHAAGEDGDLHTLTRAALVLGPHRSARRSRSASVSTSSLRPGRSTDTECSKCARNRSALPGP